MFEISAAPVGSAPLLNEYSLDYWGSPSPIWPNNVDDDLCPLDRCFDLFKDVHVHFDDLYAVIQSLFCYECIEFGCGTCGYAECKVCPPTVRKKISTNETTGEA